MIQPERIQRSRKHKQVSPNGLPIVYVGRPTKYANPYKLGTTANLTREECLSLYEKYLQSQFDEAEIIEDLKGKNLSCWCGLNQSCHADILLKIANK